ncbi:diguanylate cyclase [Candidatus Sumerlaeota bacterium]|nr:diguanylate cyclase [Candidatus Sumerlaeota bacterium]
MLTLALILLGWGAIYGSLRTWINNHLRLGLAQENRLAIEAVQSAVTHSAQAYLRARVEGARDVLEVYRNRSGEGLLSREDALRDAMIALQRQSIRETGAVFCVDDAGSVLDSPKMASYNPPEANLAAKIIETNEGYLEYGWKADGSVSRRQMAIYTIPYPEWNLQLCAAMPLDELETLTPHEELNERLLKLSASEQEFPFVLDEQGRAIAPGRWNADELTGMRDLNGKPFIQDIARQRLGVIHFTLADRKTNEPVKLGAIFSDMPELHWIVVTTYTPKIAFAPLRRLDQAAAAALLGAMLFGWLLQSGTARGLRRRIFHSTRKTARKHRERIAQLNEQLSDARLNEQSLQERLDHVSKWRYELERKKDEIEWLRKLGDDLQACRTVDETYRAFEKHARNLFPDDRGALLIFNGERDQLEGVASWGEGISCEREFPLDDCWGMRRGEPYHVHDPHDDLICPHVPAPPEHGYLCLPMSAQGENQGMLHLQFGPPETFEEEEKRSSALEAKAQLAQTVAKQFSLALANLNLREALHRQSIRDQLTGLFNRRHMEESLKRELHRAQRSEHPLGVIMLDVDHFKSFNDTYGHDEGDNLLRSMGAMLSKHTRQGDIACRYGGEEFLIIMPDASLEATQQRAEMLCKLAPQLLRIKSIKTTDRRITISLGVAVYPEHGQTGEDLLLAADSALYRAKHAGRNRVIVYQPETQQSELNLEDS